MKIIFNNREHSETFLLELFIILTYFFFFDTQIFIPYFIICFIVINFYGLTRYVVIVLSERKISIKLKFLFITYSKIEVNFQEFKTNGVIHFYDNDTEVLYIDTLPSWDAETSDCVYVTAENKWLEIGNEKNYLTIFNAILNYYASLNKTNPT